MIELDLAAMRWRKSSRSGQGGSDCVEVAEAVWRKSSRGSQGGEDSVVLARSRATIVVRDSKNPAGFGLTFDRASFGIFIAATRMGRHDL